MTTPIRRRSPSAIAVLVGLVLIAGVAGDQRAQAREDDEARCGRGWSSSTIARRSRPSAAPSPSDAEASAEAPAQCCRGMTCRSSSSEHFYVAERTFSFSYCVGSPDS